MYDPYVKGRWYRLFLESNGTAVTATEKDLDISFSGANIKLPAGFTCIDAKYDIHCVAHDAAVSMAIDRISYADGAMGIAGPVAKAFDYAYIYVFGYFS